MIYASLFIGSSCKETGLRLLLRQLFWFWTRFWWPFKSRTLDHHPRIIRCSVTRRWPRCKNANWGIWRGLKTFAGTSKRKTAKPEYQVIKSDRSLFIQLLMVAKERDLDLKQILSYSLSPVPGCLSSSDLTSIAKTTKSSLLKHMETVVPDCQLHIKPAECAVVNEAMALIQS